MSNILLFISVVVILETSPVIEVSLETSSEPLTMLTVEVVSWVISSNSSKELATLLSCPTAMLEFVGLVVL